MSETIPIPVTVGKPDRPFDDLITHITQAIALSKLTAEEIAALGLG